MVKLELQTGHVGEAGRRCVHPHLHGCVEGRDASLGRHGQAVRSSAGVGVGFHATGTDGVVALEFEINGQSDVVVGVEPRIVPNLGTVPAKALRDSVAVEGGHLVGFVAASVIDALPDHVAGLSNVGHHPSGAVGVGLGRREGGDVVALTGPLRVRGGGGGPALVHSKREIVILVDGRIGRRDGDVAEDLLKERNAAGNESNVHVQLASNWSEVAHPEVFGLSELNVDVAGEPFQRNTGFVKVRRGAKRVGQDGHVVHVLRRNAGDFGRGVALNFADGGVHTGVGDQNAGVKRSGVNPSVADAPGWNVGDARVAGDGWVHGCLGQEFVVLDGNQTGEEQKHQAHREDAAQGPLSHGVGTGEGGHQAFSSSPTGCPASEKVGQFVLDDFNGFEDFVLVSCTGDDHFSGAKDEADNLRVVQAVDETGELLGLVFHFVKRQVEGEVVQVEFAWDTRLRLAGELVNAVVVLGVVECVGSDHVLNFDGDVLEVPGLDASGAEVLDHAVDAGVDVVLVLSTGAHGTAGAEHENRQFWLGDSVDHTGELFGLVLAVELDGNVRKVKFFGNTGAGNNVHDGEAFFIGGHIKAEPHLVYKGDFGVKESNPFACPSEHPCSRSSKRGFDRRRVRWLHWSVLDAESTPPCTPHRRPR